MSHQSPYNHHRCSSINLQWPIHDLPPLDHQLQHEYMSFKQGLGIGEPCWKDAKLNIEIWYKCKRATFTWISGGSSSPLNNLMNKMINSVAWKSNKVKKENMYKILHLCSTYESKWKSKNIQINTKYFLLHVT